VTGALNILVTGSGGLVGSALMPRLAEQGHCVRPLTRAANARAGEISWNPPSEGPDPALLEGMDAVIHLAGESIASRWTEKKKRTIRESRVRGTGALAASLARMKKPPAVLISASAVGYYGDRGDEILREDSPPGDGFLAEVCRQWETAAEPASQKGIRVVHLRLGVVLSGRGGALGKMLLPFKMGIGGRIGSGRQYMSWIALEDVLQIIQFALTLDSLRGPVNAAAPNPVTNEEFAKTLGRVLNRPTFFSMPAFAARLAFGEMAEAVLLGGARVEPAKLIRSGYSFRYPHLEGALRHLLEDAHR